jgi:hypothetical protein
MNAPADAHAAFEARIGILYLSARSITRCRGRLGWTMAA